MGLADSADESDVVEWVPHSADASADDSCK
jgi:hypothetical protein